MTFAQHVNWLLQLAEPSTFNLEKRKFLNDDSDGKGNIIDTARGIVEKVREDTKTGNEYKVQYKFDDVILGVTEFYTDNAIIQIVSPYANEDIDVKISAWLQVIEKAKLYIKKNPSFYSKFPRYKESLSITISTLKDLQNPSDDTSKQPTQKAINAGKLEPYLEIIQEAGTKDMAIKSIKDEFPDFSWDRPNCTWFHNNTGKLNKKQIAHALYLIGLLKFSNDYPGESKIKKTLLDHL